MSNPSHIPSEGSFNIVLTKTISGNTVLKDPTCTFSYTWNFETNEGQAFLDQIDNTELDITLYPEGLAGTLAFMSNMEPTSYQINGQNVYIYRVIFMIDPNTGEHKAGIMFNQDGSTIETSANWSEKLTDTNSLFKKYSVS